MSGMQGTQITVNFVLVQLGRGSYQRPCKRMDTVCRVAIIQATDNVLESDMRSEF